MPLSPQEARCVELACSHLSKCFGTVWELVSGPTLDDQHPNRSSPEVLVTDGVKTAAVEVKSLVGKQAWIDYAGSWKWLRKRLSPSCGGRYCLHPPIDFHLPMDQPLIRTLRREIERVGCDLEIGERGAVRVRRRARLRYTPGGKLDVTHCSHNSSRRVVEPVSGRVPGLFWLMDNDDARYPFEHSFVTDQGREDFLNTLEAACLRARQAGETEVEWYEEWALVRDDNHPTAGDGVTITAVMEAGDVPNAVSEPVETMLASAEAKFTGRRWADLHVVVLDNMGAIFNPDLVDYAREVFEDWKPGAIDMVLLVLEGAVVQLHPRSTD